MKTSLLENRPLACIVLTAAVVISIFGIGGAKLSGVGKKADNYFTDNISGDLTSRATAAQNLLDVTKDTIGDTAAYKSAEDALADFEKAESSGEAGDIYDANQKLTSSVELLYGEYCDKAGEPSVGSVEQEQLSEFRSRNDIISHSVSDYNALARDAQKDMSGFPASLIAALTGARVEEFA